MRGSTPSPIGEEVAAIQALALFAGGELAKRLDGSLESLEVLDAFLFNLTDDAEWAGEFVRLVPGRSPQQVVTWLVVHVAYYFGHALRIHHGCDWVIAQNPGTTFERMPAIRVASQEICPLEVAAAAVKHRIAGGLVKVAMDFNAYVAGGIRGPVQ